MVIVDEAEWYVKLQKSGARVNSTLVLIYSIIGIFMPDSGGGLKISLYFYT